MHVVEAGGSESSAADFDKGDNWILNSSVNLRIFLGGIDTSDYASDGKFALCWIEMPSQGRAI
eukprot:scaffold671_cov286-Chaetoceros_neogracile.AAC.20